MGITRPPGSLAKQVSKAKAESWGITVSLSSLSCVPSTSLPFKRKVMWLIENNKHAVCHENANFVFKKTNILWSYSQ